MDLVAYKEKLAWGSPSTAMKHVHTRDPTVPGLKTSGCVGTHGLGFTGTRLHVMTSMAMHLYTYFGYNARVLVLSIVHLLKARFMLRHLSLYHTPTVNPRTLPNGDAYMPKAFMNHIPRRLFPRLLSGSLSL